jgi:opacity protein-like surface antigen
MRIVIGAAAMLLVAGGVASAQGLSSGFYVRGEVGAGFGRAVTFTDANPGAANCDLCSFSLPATVNDSVLVGGGIGYRFSPLLRADVTVDDLPSFRVSGTSTQPGNPSGSAPFSSVVIMANGYLDLNGFDPAAFGRWQPFVTAGVGVARNDAGTFSGTFTSGPLSGVPLSESGAERTTFAWGVGAGIGYAITPHVTLDVAYKYLDLGELRSGTVVSVAGAPLPPVTASRSTDFGVHTLLVDLRYSF